MSRPAGSIWNVIVTHPSTNSYRDGWERTFGKKEKVEIVLDSDTNVNKVADEVERKLCKHDSGVFHHSNGLTCMACGQSVEPRPDGIPGKYVLSDRPPRKVSARCGQEGHVPDERGWCKRCGNDL